VSGQAALKKDLQTANIAGPDPKVRKPAKMKFN
jgi:hypothetical protein